MKRLLIALVLLPLLVACSIPGLASCADQSEEFFNQIEPLARRWDDANKLANQTPRMQLAAQIANLQAIRRDVQDLKPPECSKPAQTALVGTMDATIQGYVDFLAQKPDSVVQVSFQKASSQMDAYIVALAKAKGLPDPPTPPPTTPIGAIGKGRIKGSQVSVWKDIGPPAQTVIGTVSENDVVDVYEVNSRGVLIHLPDGQEGWVSIESITYPDVK